MTDFELIFCIVNADHGSKALKIAKQHGVKGGTICISRGAVKNKILEFLDLNYVLKETVLMVTEKENAEEVLTALDKEFVFSKPNHGILFTVSLDNFIGTKNLSYNNSYNTEDNRSMHEIIFVVVNKGFAEDVIEAAKKGGAKGGTIMNARGSGIHETDMVFAMPIEPEKEVVFILTETGLTELIVKSISDELKINEPGNGIIFTFGVHHTYGLRE